MRRPNITFPAAVELIRQSATNDSPLQGTFISEELLKAIDCEHCSKREDLRFCSTSLQHVNLLSNLPEYALLGLVEQYGTSCLQCAGVIHEKTKHLLDGEAACNTAVHHAARCRGIRTLFHLMCLVLEEGDNDRVSKALRRTNNKGETALHEAVKCCNLTMVELLLWMDPNLANAPSSVSALYVAVAMGHRLVAERLYECGSSFSGPSGKNVLHAAVLFDKEMVCNILKWDATLAEEGDADGDTPLHLACLTLYHPVADQALLRGYKEAAFRSNVLGLFPIHLASSSDQIDMIKQLISQCPKCIFLPNPEGKTMIHFAVLNRSVKTVWHILGNWNSFSDILNLRDSEGNTSLHSAVSVGDLFIVCTLLRIPGLLLDIVNEQKQTALDLAVIKCENLCSVYWEEHDDAYIKHSLELIGAKRIYPAAHIEMTGVPAPLSLEGENETEKLIACSEKLAIGSALFAACTFGASFALPGGVKEEGAGCGTFKLAKGPLFNTLSVSNWLGVICSVVATLCAMLAAMPSMQLKYRRYYAKLAFFFTKSSLTALVATVSFLGSVSFGKYSLLTAGFIWLGNPIAFLVVNWKRVVAGGTCVLPVMSRLGKKGKVKFVLSCFGIFLLELWPLVISGIWLALRYYAVKDWRVCQVKPEAAMPPAMSPVSGGGQHL